MNDFINMAAQSEKHLIPAAVSVFFLLMPLGAWGSVLGAWKAYKNTLFMRKALRIDKCYIRIHGESYHVSFAKRLLTFLWYFACMIFYVYASYTTTLYFYLAGKWLFNAFFGG